MKSLFFNIVPTKGPSASPIALSVPIQIREGPILPGKGVGKKLPQIGHYSIVGIVDKIDENNRFSFNSIRLSFILELAEIISLSLLLST